MYFDNFSVSDVVRLVYDLPQAVLGVVRLVYNLPQAVLDVVRLVYDLPQVVLDVVRLVYDLPQVILEVVHAVYDVARAGSGAVSVRQDSAGIRNDPHVSRANVATPAKETKHATN
jgi:hypothetical protein